MREQERDRAHKRPKLMLMWEKGGGNSSEIVADKTVNDNVTQNAKRNLKYMSSEIVAEKSDIQCLKPITILVIMIIDSFLKNMRLEELGSGESVRGRYL